MMKNTVFLFGLIVSIFTIQAQPGYSQCEPDTINCIDVNEPGQVCPSQLEDGIIGVAYEKTITIIAPDTVTIDQVKIAIGKITLDKIENLPPGISYAASTSDLFPNEPNCVSINGTPVEEGNYPIKIYITPHILVGFVYYPVIQLVDSTSVSLKIESALGINSLEKVDFSLIHAYPNPFMTSTRIGYLEPLGGVAELRIMNMLGKQIYGERINAVKGENYFQFTGDDLPAGYYVYAIIREQKSLKGKLLKRE
jgi:hypothetical protein